MSRCARRRRGNRRTGHAQDPRDVELRGPHPAPRVREALPVAIRLRLDLSRPTTPRHHHQQTVTIIAIVSPHNPSSPTEQNATHHSTPRRRRAVRPARRARLVRARGGEAPRERVQRHLVVGHEVDTLDDVDFAVVWPVVALCPDAGPYLRGSWRRGTHESWRRRTEQPYGRCRASMIQMVPVSK